jgi:hypothetical protein
VQRHDRIELYGLELVRRSAAEAYLQHAKKALEARAAQAASTYLREAERRGVDVAQAARVWKDVLRLRKLDRPLDERRLRAIETAVTASREKESNVAAHLREALLDDARWPVRRLGARLVLGADPGHARATAVVRAEVPERLLTDGPFDAREWIDLVDALRATSPRFVERPHSQSGITRQQREYGAALHRWRKDLIALETDDLLVLTPVAQPARVALCLSLGEMVCAALEEVFAHGKKVRTDPWPMIVHLYESKEEYVRESARQDSSGSHGTSLEKTAGHYNPATGVSHLFVHPSGNGFDEVLRTFAHELTHHWIDERCPLFSNQERGPMGPGYWIVEGMATFVEEFDWDLEKRTWQVLDPRASSLTLVSDADASHLIPWRLLFSMTPHQFHEISTDQTVIMPQRQRFGYRHKVSPRHVFYAQAAAACSHMFHEPALRPALLEFVRDYYTGKAVSRPFSERFGMTPDEMGARVLEHARAATASSLPPLVR